MVVLYETAIITCTMSAFFTMITLLYGLQVYADACLLDIKTLFSQVDRHSKHHHCGQAMLARCKEAADLHERLNRYC